MVFIVVAYIEIEENILLSPPTPLEITEKDRKNNFFPFSPKLHFLPHTKKKKIKR